MVDFFQTLVAIAAVIGVIGLIVFVVGGPLMLLFGVVLDEIKHPTHPPRERSKEDGDPTLY